MTTDFTAKNTGQLHEIARAIAPIIQSAPIVAFYGEMGAGKTTFIRALCEEMGIVGAVNSPTFSIINEYETEQGDIVYHFDFYRIKSMEEAFDFGYEEYFSSGNICFIEWPELIEPLLPEKLTRIHIQVLPDETRNIRVHLSN